MKKFCGVFPPVITVFDGNGRIDLEACRRHADFLIEKGVDGLAYLGTSGEFCVLTMEEKKTLIAEMVRHVDVYKRQGMHISLVPISSIQLADHGSETAMGPGWLASNIAQGGACLLYTSGPHPQKGG